MWFAGWDRGRSSAGLVGELFVRHLAFARADCTPIGAWHCVTIVERTSRRGPQHQITAVLAVVGGACCVISTSSVVGLTLL